MSDPAANLSTQVDKLTFNWTHISLYHRERGGGGGWREGERERERERERVEGGGGSTERRLASSCLIL